VEVLPRDAEVWVDGGPLGRGAHEVAVRDPGHVYVFRASAAGFADAERAVPGAEAAGARVGLALRPLGLGAGARLDLDEPGGLASAAAALLRDGRASDALDYAARAGELAPRAPAVHRLLGDAHRQLGHRQRAAREYEQYLQEAPDARDRDEVERAVEELRR